MLVPADPRLMLVDLFFSGALDADHSHKSLNWNALGTFSVGPFLKVSVHRVVHRLHVLPDYWVHTRD